MSAELLIEQCGPFVSLQDRGRFGFMRFGVTESGPMDRFSFHLAQAALDTEGPALEVSLGGIALKCLSGSVTVRVSGGAFSILLDGKEQSPWSTLTLNPGSKLAIRPGLWGSWCYVAFAGKVEAPEWLGSQSTHMDTGLCGMPFVPGDMIRISDPQVLADQASASLGPEPFKPTGDIRVVMGPQDRFFDADALTAFTESKFEITREYNRMGMRLSGPKLKVNAALDMPSEPIARGSLQIPGHGDPLCLMADHGTAGGYPKIATVISADFDRLAQMRAGDFVRFVPVSEADAVAAARAHRDLMERSLQQIRAMQVSLEARLWSNNLISGVVDMRKN